MFNLLTLHARKSLIEAENIARSCRSAAVLPEHLLLAIYLERGSLGSVFFHDIGLGEEAFDCLFKSIQKNPGAVRGIPPSDALKQILTRAFHIASDLRSRFVGTEHLTNALMEARDADVVRILEVSRTRTKKEETAVRPQPLKMPPLPDITKIFEALIEKVTERPVGEDDEEEYDHSILDHFCTNLNAVAEEEHTVIGRDEEIARLTGILGRKHKNNALIIGEAGVGKTALVAGLASRIEAGRVPDFLAGKIIYELDLALVVAGTTFRGEFEERMKEIIRVASERPDIILFIDEIHTLVGAGNGGGALDAANILKPALSRGEVRMIGATTRAEFKRHIEKDAAMDRRFQTIHLNEPTKNETLAILRGLREGFESFHGARIDDGALEAAVDLSIRYLPDRFLPDKAIDLIDEATAHRRVRDTKNGEKLQAIRRKRDTLAQKKRQHISAERYEDASTVRDELRRAEEELNDLMKDIQEMRQKRPVVITVDDIVLATARMANIPEKRITESRRTTPIRTLKRTLTRSVIGQPHAAAEISETLARAWSGLSHPRRPMGSFLLLGPTGVGKTHTAAVLARHLFGTRRALIRIDMSEFSQQHTTAGLLGAPAGYIGYGEGGRLTERIRRAPQSVVLLDEIEKAHESVLNLLLQILEEGELTDGEGRHASFRSAVIILTSNIAGALAAETAPSLGFGKDTLSHDTTRDRVLRELSFSLRPEILGRLDNILVYRPLNETTVKKIAARELASVASRLRTRGTAVTYSQEVLRTIAEESMRGGSGARMVRGVIQKRIESPLAQHILSGKTAKKISIEVRDGKIILS